MKKDRLAHLPLKFPEGKANDAAYLRGLVERQMHMLRSYQARQDAIVIELGKIQKRPDLADLIVQGILEQTLAVSKARVKAREDALVLAVEVLKVTEDAFRERGLGQHMESLTTVMARLKELTPDLFEEPVEKAPGEAGA